MASERNLPVRFEREPHLLDYLSVVERRWRVIVPLALLVFAGVTLYTLMQVHVYQAGVVLRVGAKPEASSELLQSNRQNYFSLESEIQILLSNELAEEAAVSLTRLWRVEKWARGVDIQVRELTVPAEVVAPVLELTSATTFRLATADGRTLADGQSGVPFVAGDVAGVVIIGAGKPGQRLTLTRPDLLTARAMVSAGRNAGEYRQGASLLELTIQNTDPSIARDAANALAEVYLDNNRASRVNEATLMLTFIDEQLKSVGGQLDLSEQALQSFKIKTGLERLSTEGASVVEAAVELEKQRSDLQFRRQRLSSYLGELRKGVADFSPVQEIPGMPELIRQLLELRAKRNTLLLKFTAEHPAVVELDEQLRQTTENIVQVTRSALRGIDQQLADIGQKLQQGSERLAQVPEDELELVRLTRANQVNAELYSYLLQRQQETRIRQASTSSNVEIVSRAMLPKTPIRPNKRKNLVLGLLAGAMVGLGVAFLLDYLDRSLKDEDDVQEHLGLPLLGTIPRIDDDGGGPGKRLVAHLAPHTPANEAFLGLRTNLLFILTNQKHKTILVTSCLPEEGKSTVAANLAVSLAQTGAKTLVIDCDLRRPAQHRIFRQPETPGLSDILIGNTRKGVHRLAGLDLDMISAGTEPPNPTQLLHSEAMRQFLEKAHARYDYVILDVPPLLPVADALILASQVDVNLLVLESCRIPQRLAVRALKSLQTHDAVPAGVILNDKTGKGARYYGAYSYYEGKYYQGYYRRNEPAPPVAPWRKALGRLWELVNR
jgi:tyrosine-protein kinase Etk/Wzc